MRFAPVLTLGIALAVLSATTPARAGQNTPAAPKPLYERLGGVYNIAAVVDDFIERIYVNDVVNENAAVAGARSQARKAGLKVQVTTLVCQVTGGPCKYAGQGMKESHARFKITEKEWAAMAADFKASLDKFKVPDAEQQELFAIVESTKPDIVVGATAKR
jgi:hemoglobin